jgi:hypothetical protein
MPQNNRRRDEQRAIWKAQGLTARGTPFARGGPYRVKAVAQAAQKMVEGKIALRRASQRAAEQNAADRADADRRAQLAHEADPRVIAFREAKVAKARRLARLMADAKRDYEAEQQRCRDSQRGGRPRKAINLRTDPADALLNALGTTL